MCDSGFIKASAHNLPAIDVFMVTEFLKSDDRFNAAEIRGAKASLASRESYGDKAVGYVQLKRDGDNCMVKCRVCPEHKVRSKTYRVTLNVNEKESKIQDLECDDCAAAKGGCKHALAFLMWLHRRSEDPAPTEVTCYWKKSRLSGVGTAIKYVEAKDLRIGNVGNRVADLPDNSTFLQEILNIAQAKQIDSQLSRMNFDLDLQKTSSLSLHRLALKFNSGGPHSPSADSFLTFCADEMTEALCMEVERMTKQQSDCALWYDLRYGRITASKLYEAAHCKTDDGSLVNQIIGVSKVHETDAMLRGKELEKHVISEVTSLLDIKVQNAGLFLLPKFPMLGASPDGLTDQFIIEIKCPSNDKELQRFLTNNVINPKCVAQMQLQMLATHRKKGLFCVADPAFETTKKVHIERVTYDEAKAQDLIEKAMQF